MINVNKLKGRMKEMGYSQKQMAHCCSIHEQTYGDYLKSGKLPSDIMEIVAQVLEIDDYNFFFETNSNVKGIE